MINQVFEFITVDFLEQLIEQAPTVAVLLYLVYRQDKRIARCYDEILALLNKKDGS